MRTIYYVIRGLGPNDARIDWWGCMRRYIETKQFDLVFEVLRAHKYDHDYKEQMYIVCGEIIRRLGPNEEETMDALHSGKMTESDA
jgi:hypothetical protein